MTLPQPVGLPEGSMCAFRVTIAWRTAAGCTTHGGSAVRSQFRRTVCGIVLGVVLVMACDARPPAVVADDAPVAARVCGNPPAQRSPYPDGADHSGLVDDCGSFRAVVAPGG